MSIDAMKKMVAALEESLDLVEQDYDTDWRHGLPTRKAQLDGKLDLLNAHKEAIAAGVAAIEAAQQVEPVAWMGEYNINDIRDHYTVVMRNKTDFDRMPERVRALVFKEDLQK